jgi:3-hydroxybutyryl-CoA dehydrogenase
MNPKDVKKAAVIGAGTMGHSIAVVFAKAGIEVSLVDVDDIALAGASEMMASVLKTLSDNGLVAADNIEGILGGIHTSTDLEAAAAEADFVVEAVPEVPDVKKEIFTRLDRACADETVIASNTSGLNIFQFAEVEKPERLLIAHWWAPPHIIPLVEVVPGPDTSPDAVSLTAALMERLGKVPVVMKEFSRGFIVNKIQNTMVFAVSDLLTNGLASPEDIDKAVKYSLGIRIPIIGVVQSLDFTGLNVVSDVGKSYGLTVPLIEEKIEQGLLGVKTSCGLYDYGDRTEQEICAKRDNLFFKMIDYLGELDAFEPI